ncbi:aminotransferase class V-fold PLP-dependent enzyme [Candidatus Parabeggiatoa sp. HSG14]|uniref:aminotransferase class V-fold PLP-dependent enzyme n=1 Tax=Candidatus Parabeggiatoa sp. HSG14 TaxID=3055593 RepID=UPI0025A7D81C|nr:aminotransferase class V-fold PLP-dependent enzyme [Thiotrichales bacterium HSG14]
MLHQSTPLNLNPEFPLNDNIIYLNHAAVSPWPQRTAEAVQRFAIENVTQGATHYPQWQKQEVVLREQLRDLLNAPASTDIALLKNTSEALSVVAYGLTWQAGDNIVITDQEFPSNRIVWESLQNQGVTVRQANISNITDPEASLFALVDERTRLISVSAVQYASGLRMDLEKIGIFCRNHKILFCVDAIQSLGALQFDVQAIHADFVMADGHKWMLAPEGLAVFYCKAEQREQLQLKQYGWHMIENAHNFDVKTWTVATSGKRFECGSPNMLNIHALSASLSLLTEVGMATVEEKVLDNTHYLLENLTQLPDIKILSPQEPHRYAGIVTFSHQRVEHSVLFHHLLKQGVICAQRGGGIRFSPHFYTPQEKLKQAIKYVNDCPIT